MELPSCIVGSNVAPSWIYGIRCLSMCRRSLLGRVGGSWRQRAPRYYKKLWKIRGCTFISTLGFSTTHTKQIRTTKTFHDVSLAVPGIFWQCQGHLTESSWTCPRHILEMYWTYPGDCPQLSQNRTKIWAVPRTNPRHVLDTNRNTSKTTKNHYILVAMLSIQ